MEIKCKVLRIGQTEIIGEKQFKKRELIVEYAENPQYPQIIKFEANKDNCEKLDELKSGDEINLNFNLNGREWTNKESIVQVFNTLTIWKFEKLANGNLTPALAASPEDDNLPF